MMFAALVLERDPLAWSQVPYVVLTWLQSAGTIAALGLFLVFVFRAGSSFTRLFSPPGTSTSPLLVRLATLCTILSWVGFGLLGLLFAATLVGMRRAQGWLPGADPEGPVVGDYLFAISGLLSLAVIVFPVLKAVFVDMRIGRVWAVARLSIKEASRNGSIAVFSVVAILFLFADWFIPYKPEDQVRNYVWVLSWTMLVLFLLSAGVLGSFSIPNDIKNLTIHTVVTKPITKFEVVLGRFLGYGVLITVSLLLVGVLSLGYILRGVTEEAKKESFLARVPVYGGLGFINTKGDSVGREWDYRRYIAGQNMSGGKRQYAFWYFDDLSEVQPREDGMVRFEFSFDIFRLTKGEENKGILCTFKFSDPRVPVETLERMLEERRQEKVKRQDAARKAALPNPIDFAELNPKIDADLLKEFPIYEEPGVEVTDYHTQKIDIPYAVIQRLLEVAKAGPDDGAPVMRVLVNIDPDRGSAAQMLGVAPRDLYILAAEKGFYVNFLKGLVGLWFSALMVLGVAICCSTYLSGVISFLVTMFLFLTGFFLPSISQLANNQGPGGGPAEAFQRMVVLRSNMVAPLDETPTTSLIRGFDELTRWWLRRMLTLIPDASRYDLHPYVANGFDISVGQILFVDNFLPLVGYLIPWFILAFYLINYREIANPT